MKKLLTLEYFKNLTYRPFQIFSGLYFVVLILLLFIGLIDLNISEGFNINLKEQGIYNFPGIWNFITYIVALLKIFLGLIIVFSICQEFTNRMFKQNLIDGLSREEFIASKLLTITIFTLISTLVVFGLTLVIGYAYSEKTDANLVFSEVYFVGNYFVKLFTFFCFLMFLSVLFRKSIFVFLGFFLWWIAEGIFSGVETFTRTRSLGSEQRIQYVQDHFFISKILPLESMSNLIPNPIIRLKMAEMMGFQYKFHYPYDSLIACLVWSVIFIGGSYLILKKRDW